MKTIGKRNFMERHKRLKSFTIQLTQNSGQIEQFKGTVNERASKVAEQIGMINYCLLFMIPFILLQPALN